MNANLKTGIDELQFGMKQQHVIDIYGNPDKKYEDEENNIIFLYNKPKLRLTFYSEEDFKLGYMIAANPELELFGQKVIGRKFSELKTHLAENGITKFTKDEFDGYENFFNEEHWIIFQTEFAEVTKVEIGAIINDSDEFDWVFKTR